MVRHIAAPALAAALSCFALAAARADCSLTNSYPGVDGLRINRNWGAFILPDCRVIPLHAWSDPTGTPYSSTNPPPLPSGAASEAGHLATIDTKMPALVGGRVPVDPSGVTQPVSAASLPLPAGAAIESGHLATIDSKLASPLPVKSGSIVITTTEASITGGAPGVQILAANASRRYLGLIVDGTGACRIGYGSAPTASTGEPLAAAAAQYGQGGSVTYEASSITQQAIYAYCAVTSSIAIKEGQ